MTRAKGLLLVGLFMLLAVARTSSAECGWVLWAQDRGDQAKWTYIKAYPDIKYGAGLGLCNAQREKAEREQTRWQWHCVPASIDPRQK